MLTEQLQPGQRFEYFRIEAFVVRTCITTIYRATDLRTGQLVAIKIPHPELECDPTFYSRFQREIAIGKKLKHPGVVQTIDMRRHGPALHRDGMGGRKSFARNYCQGRKTFR